MKLGVVRLRVLAASTRPVHPDTEAALQRRSSELPEPVRTPAQLLGRRSTGCEGTHGVFPRWRHLDAGGVRCQVECNLRRLYCPGCGDLPEMVEWARSGARYTGFREVSYGEPARCTSRSSAHPRAGTESDGRAEQRSRTSAGGEQKDVARDQQRRHVAG